MKKLSDNPNYVKVHDAVQKLQSEKAEVLARIDEINVALSQPKQPQIAGGSAWDIALEGKAGYECAVDNRQGLRDEQLELEGRIRFLDEALTVGTQEFDKITGQASLEVCQSVRKEWVAHVRQVLEHVKGLCDANTALDTMRADLERNGIRTDSFPYAKFDIGTWSDPYGGKVVGFQRFVAESYPELTAAAGMEIKSKLAVLAKREEQWKEQENDESVSSG